MKKVNHFISGRGAVRVLALALIAQLAFATAGLNKAMAQTVVATGPTGDCTWTITGTPGNYTLTISGNGAMKDYSANAPWNTYSSGIKTLDIQYGVTAIGNWAFGSCNNLTGTLTIPNSVETIGYDAFDGCYGFTGALEIPNSITTIGNEAFMNCTGFETLKIGTSVETIGYNAFSYCSGFTGALEIPNSVKTIGQIAFYGCSGFSGTLKIGTSVETIRYSAFANCSNLTGVTIPSSLKTISSSMFSGCSSLTSINIPASVTSIESNAFNNCTGLTDITLNSATPPTLGTYTFYGLTLSYITLYIPTGSEAAYQLAGWTGFKAYVEETVFYDVWANGERFSSDNLTVTCGQGTAVYDPSISTLTLTDATINTGCTIPAALAKTYCESGIFTLVDLNVVLAGDNIIENANGTGIDADAQLPGPGIVDYFITDISVSGPGSLTITEVVQYNGYGVYTRGALAIDGVTMNVNSMASGLWTEKALSITNSRIVIKNLASNYFSLVVNHGDAVIDNSVIVSNRQPIVDRFILLDPGYSYSLTNNSAIITYNEDAAPFTEGTNDGIISDPEDVAVWAISGSDAGVSYTNGSNSGFIAIPNVTVQEAAGPPCVNPTASGTFGQGNTLTWTLCPDGLLTIGGTGVMPDYASSGNRPPWESHKGAITGFAILSGVTSVGAYAFYDYAGLETAAIPASVKTIGLHAFSGCSSLTAFTVNAGNMYYSIDSDGRLFNKDKTSLIRYPAGKTGDSYTFPSSVTDIGAGAFEGCSNLTSLTIPEAVAAIGEYAFANCTALTEVTVLRATPVVINANVFSGVPLTAKVTLYYPAEATESDYKTAGWTGFKEYVQMCPVPVKISGSNTTWTLCSDGTLSIGGTGAMPNFSYIMLPPWDARKDDIKAVVIGSGVTATGGSAFDGCSSLTGIMVDAGNTALSSDGGVLFNKNKTRLILYPLGKPGNSYTVPEGVTVIDAGAFADCSSLASISIPPTVNDINDWAFSGCINLTSLFLPEGVNKIGMGAFYACTSLASVTLPSTMNDLNGFAFATCTALTGITVNYTSASDIPDISSLDVFAGVTPGDVTLYIAGGLDISDYTVKGWPAFGNTCPAGTFGAAGGLTWTLCGGTLTIEGSDAMDSSPWSSNSDDITDVIIAEGVTSIGDYVFSDCNELVSVSIPSGVTSIGSSAFAGCPKLVSVTIPASTGTIGELAFASCTSLESVNFVSPSSLTVIGTAAFQFCYALTSIAIPASVTDIRAFAFIGTGLQSVTFESPSSLTTIEGVSFQDCTDLTSIAIPASVTAIGTQAFRNSGLTAVTVHWTSAGDIPDINGKDVFDGLTLSSVTLNVPAGSEALYESAPVWQEFNIAGQSAAILTLSQTALSFPATAGSQTVNLTANIAWTAVSSEAWLTVTPLLGTGDAVLTISAAAHTGSSARTATVIVSDGGSLTPTVTVTQAAAVIIVKPSVTTGLLNYDLSPVAYDGQPHPVAVTPKSGVTGLGAMIVTYNGLSAPPVEAGDYIVTFIFDEGADYAATTLEPGVLTITSAVGNTAIPASGIWTSDGAIHIAAASAGTASVYNTVGHLVATRSYTSGETVAIPLPKGVYFILSEGRSYKVIVRD